MLFALFVISGTDMKYERLFSPITIRNCVFSNRIMSTAAVTRLAAEDGHVTEAFKERYKRLVQGGLGAMVVEAAVVLPSKSSFNLRVSDDEFIPELQDFVKEIRLVNPDVKVGLQLIHFLKLSRSGWRQKVEDLKPEEITVIPGQFASGAMRAREAGFNFVELHMAHFTTLASFLSLLNKRKDEYGGDFEGRVKLPTEVVLATRKALGNDFPIGARILGEEFTKEGNTLLQSTRVARRLASLGLDYISVSAGERFEDADPPPPNFPPFAGTGYSGYRMSPRWWNPDGVQVYLAEGIRKAVREAGYEIPIVTAGKIRTPELAEEILDQGRADIIGMARALLADPDWPLKAKADRADDIVKCAACGYCSESDERYETVTCIEWPKGVLNPASPWLLVPPCKAACPAGIDIRSYIDEAAQGHYEKALHVIEEKIPFPATIGRVCPHPCEAKCNRGEYDASIAINGLKRFIADLVAARQGRKNVSQPPRVHKERVAIIGAGPAGLTAGFNLVQRGYGVTVFEALPVAGGMLTVGIPEYRLPRGLVQAEIEDIQKWGVEIRLNSPVGKNGLALDGLFQQGYHAVFIATGAHRSITLGVSGEDLEGVHHGTSFLREINLGKKVVVGGKVAVVGGGNVAIDAARTAFRCGSKEVFIVYRRSREEMPAYREEVEAAEREGIKILYLATPSKILGKNGQVTGIECLRAELGEPDESGRRRPIPVRGSEFVMDVNAVILAIGETPDLFLLDLTKFRVTSDEKMKVDPLSLMTNVPGVFAGGDAVSGPATVIEAIAAGKKAAISIDKYLRGEKIEDEEIAPRIIGMEEVDVGRFNKRPRQTMSAISPKDRIRGLEEVNLGFTELEALREADRCFQCGLFPNKEK
jgi:NADPH-dependent glutamate synthase beta subunit-like oxidoreductase/2,4-dienoyl-CoA reductase-like NADH-dependent reductase (Old Yellow Enzyme family)